MVRTLLVISGLVSSIAFAGCADPAQMDAFEGAYSAIASAPGSTTDYEATVSIVTTSATEMSVSANASLDFPGTFTGATTLSCQLRFTHSGRSRNAIAGQSCTVSGRPLVVCSATAQNPDGYSLDLTISGTQTGSCSDALVVHFNGSRR